MIHFIWWCKFFSFFLQKIFTTDRKKNILIKKKINRRKIHRLFERDFVFNYPKMFVELIRSKTNNQQYFRFVYFPLSLSPLLLGDTDESLQCPIMEINLKNEMDFLISKIEWMLNDILVWFVSSFSKVMIVQMTNEMIPKIINA